MFTLLADPRCMLLVASLALQAELALAAPQSCDQSLTAFIDSGDDQVLVRHTKGNWTAEVNPSAVASARAHAHQNACALKPADAIQGIASCLAGRACSKQLPHEVLSCEILSSEQQDQTDSRLQATLNVGENLFVAFQPSASNAVLIVDLRLGKLSKPKFVASSTALDIENRKVFHALCSERDYQCQVQRTDIGSDDAVTIAKVDVLISDMKIASGNLHVIARRLSASKGLLAGIGSIVGHPSSYEDWVILSINLQTGSSRESPLVFKKRNAFGLFTQKWSDSCR